MPQSRHPQSNYDAVLVDRGPDPVMVQGVPISPENAADRIGFLPPEETPALPAPDFVRVFADSGEDVTPIADGCRCHRWFRADDGSEWMAREIPSTDVRRRPAKGERFVVQTSYYGNRETVTRYAATRGDRRAHLASLAATEHAFWHPRQGAYVYARAVSEQLRWLRTVDDVIEHLESNGMRLTRLGSRIGLSHPAATPIPTGGDQFHMRPRDVELELLRDWAPLIAARLGGPRVGCDVGGCENGADVVLMGGAFACVGHADVAVGQPAARSAPKGIRAAIGAAVASAVGA